MVVLEKPGSSSSSPDSAVKNSLQGYDQRETLEEQVKQSVVKMELSTGVFDARHSESTEVLLALLTQNKELEGNNIYIQPLPQRHYIVLIREGFKNFAKSKSRSCKSSQS